MKVCTEDGCFDAFASERNGGLRAEVTQFPIQRAPRSFAASFAALRHVCRGLAVAR